MAAAAAAAVAFGFGTAVTTCGTAVAVRGSGARDAAALAAAGAFGGVLGACISAEIGCSSSSSFSSSCSSSTTCSSSFVATTSSSSSSSVACAAASSRAVATRGARRGFSGATSMSSSYGEDVGRSSASVISRGTNVPSFTWAYSRLRLLLLRSTSAMTVSKSVQNPLTTEKLW